MTLDALIKKHVGNLLSLQMIAANKLAVGVVSKTPVDEGGARLSWTPALNSVKTRNINPANAISEQQVLETARNEITGVVNDMKIGDTFYIANAQPYIGWLEFMQRVNKNGKTIINGGQEGHMIARTKAEWQQTVNSAARDLS